MAGSEVGGVPGGPIMGEGGGTRPGEMTKTNKSITAAVVTNKVHLLLELPHKHKRDSHLRS